MNHRLVHPSAARLTPWSGESLAAAHQPNWPSFRGVAVKVGDATQTTVWTKANAPAEMMKNAEDLLADAVRIEAFDNGIFDTAGGHCDVIVYDLGGRTDGTGGADHWACSFDTGGAIEVCAAYGRSMRCSALYEAERSECQMDGRLCGLGSTGEALSRWCAMVVSNNALADFVSVPDWIKSGTRNYVTSHVSTDRDYPAIGCGMAFISWILKTAPDSPKLANVAQAMVAAGDSCELRRIGQQFGLPEHPFVEFVTAVRALGPVTSDDPFGALSTPATV